MKSRYRLAWLTCACLALIAGTALAEAGNYLGPSVVIASKDGTSLFVLNVDAKQIAVVGIAGRKVARTIALPAEPTGMTLSPDGGKLYVTCVTPLGTVSAIDVASGRITATIPAGHYAGAPVVSPDGKRLYVCNRFNNDVSVIDLEAKKEIARTAAVREPVAAAITPDGKTLVMANLLPNDRSDAYDVAATVQLIDTATRQSSADPFAQRQLQPAGRLRIARRQARLRGPHSGPLPDAHHATGARLDEHERLEHPRRPRRRSWSTRSCWTTSTSGRPIRGAWPQRPTAVWSASPTRAPTS